MGQYIPEDLKIMQRDYNIVFKQLVELIKEELNTEKHIALVKEEIRLHYLEQHIRRDLGGVYAIPLINRCLLNSNLPCEECTGYYRVTYKNGVRWKNKLKRREMCEKLTPNALYCELKEIKK